MVYKNHTFVSLFIEIKFIHYYSCVMVTMEYVNIFNDKVNEDEIIIQRLLVIKYVLNILL